uniref:Hexosyltransferase n=1 Tax=Caenorhabditis tropicalis TaxID=1561998 RepID=A0A1I7TRM9_9PELO
MRMIGRLFVFLLALISSVLFVVLTVSAVLFPSIIQEDEIYDEHCINMPPHHYIHPVFLASGPPIQSEPRPVYEAHRVSSSAKLNCNLQNKTLIIINSHLNHTAFRDMQREVFRSEWLNENNAVMYFVVASNDTIDIENEKNRYGDIIQVDITEDYHNITYKSIFWIKEIAKCEHGPKLFIKLDDDVHIDIVGFQLLIKRYRTMDDFIACRVISSGPVVRNDTSKWYLSKEEYKFSTLGTYCQGMVYFVSGNLMPILNKNIDKNQYLWMDDWYVTRSLVGDYKISYYSLDQHSISPNTINELSQSLIMIQRRKWRTIFAHFRPPQK